MLEVSGPCSFIYNLAVAHCSTRPRHPWNRTKTSPVQTTCIHSTRNFTPESRSSCWCLWDIQFWLTARVGHIQPLALNQPRILAQRRVTNFTWHSMTRALDPSTPLSGKQGQVLNAELSWVCLDFEHHHKQLFCLHSGKLGLGYTCIHQEVQVQHCTGFLDTWLKRKPQLSHNTNFQGADHKVGWN